MTKDVLGASDRTDGDARRDGRVWFITGASSGFGRALTALAVQRGDTVVAAGRRREPLRQLQEATQGGVDPVVVDVRDIAAAAAAIDDAIRRHGQIDILVNNAGHGQVGAVEETTDAELREIMDVHLHGPAALVRAVLPHMRERGSGAIIQMSSFGGQLSVAGFGAYSASKCALEGLSEALAEELAPFGIRVLIVEPGAFRTGFSGAPLQSSTELPAYAPTVGPTRRFIKGIDGTQAGDPAKAARAIMRALFAEQPPLRLVLGNDAVDALLGHLSSVRKELLAWEPLSRAVEFEAEPAVASGL